MSDYEKNEVSPIEIIQKVEADPASVFNKDSWVTPQALSKAFLSYEAKFSLRLDTKTGRQEVSSRAHRVSKLKVAIENAGKKKTEDARAAIKLVNDAKAEFTRFLEEARDAIKLPVTNWEKQEEARVEQHRLTGQRISDLGVVALTDTSATITSKLQELREIDTSELAMQEFAEFADKRRMEAIRILEEALPRIQKQEADQAELEALRQAQADRAAADAEALRLKEQAERDAERERQNAEAERLRKIELDQAAARAAEAARREAEEAAERDRLEQERRRQQAEDERRAAEKAKRDEEEARARDVKHREEIDRSAADEISARCGIDADAAELVVNAISGGLIPHVTITY